MKLRSVTIDSSVFITAWNGEERGHDNSCRFFAKILENDVTIHVPEITVFEITNVLTRLGLKHKLSSYLATFQNDGIEIVPMTQELFVIFRDLATKITLKTADLVVCSTAKMTQSTLVTWDKKLLRQASRVLRGILPESL